MGSSPVSKRESLNKVELAALFQLLSPSSTAEILISTAAAFIRASSWKTPSEDLLSTPGDVIG